MKRHLFASAAFALAAIGSLVAGSMTALAAVDQNQWIPVSGTQPDDCNGATWQFSGEAHLLLHITTDSSGGMHIDVRDNTAGIKLLNLVTGATGVGSETDHQTVNINSGANEATLNGQFTVITSGATPNELITYLLHLTVNANGTVTSSIDSLRIRCSG